MECCIVLDSFACDVLYCLYLPQGHQLLTMHPGTDLNADLSYYNASTESFVDFYGLQSGYGEGGYLPDKNGSAYVSVAQSYIGSIMLDFKVLLTETGKAK